MNAHIREPDTFVQFTPETRSQIEKAIEGLVTLLDQCDGDADFEPELAGFQANCPHDREGDALEDCEDGGDDEPWLATVYLQGQVRLVPDCDDRELDTGDDEPWLSTAAFQGRTGLNGACMGDDRELDDADDEETGDDEPYLANKAEGWTNVASRAWACDYELDEAEFDYP